MDLSKQCIIMEFRTKRCNIGYFKNEHIDQFISYRNNLEWMKYQSFKGLTKEEYSRAVLPPKTLQDGVQLAICSKETGDLLGDLYIRQEDDFCWIGYTISPNNARQGYTYEVVSAAVDNLKTMGINHLRAATLEGNTPSISLLKKLNFTFDIVEDGEYIYSLTL